MNHNGCRGEKAGKSEAVADLLHQHAGRSQSRRGNVGAAEVVHDAADGDVGDGDSRLAESQ